MDRHKTMKFVKVFSLKSFSLYGITPLGLLLSSVELYMLWSCSKPMCGMNPELYALRMILQKPPLTSSESLRQLGSWLDHPGIKKTQFHASTSPPGDAALVKPQHSCVQSSEKN